MDQANLLLFPIEIARIVSILIQGTDHGGRKDASLKQVTTEQLQFYHATFYRNILFYYLVTQPFYYRNDAFYDKKGTERSVVLARNLTSEYSVLLITQPIT